MTENEGLAAVCWFAAMLVLLALHGGTASLDEPRETRAGVQQPYPTGRPPQVVPGSLPPMGTYAE